MAAFDERQDAVVVEQLLIDRSNDVKIDLDRVEVQQRHAKLMGCGSSDATGVRQVLINEVGNQRQLLFFCEIDRLKELFLGDQSVLHKPSWQAGKIGL